MAINNDNAIGNNGLSVASSATTDGTTATEQQVIVSNDPVVSPSLGHRVMVNRQTAVATLNQLNTASSAATEFPVIHELTGQPYADAVQATALQALRGIGAEAVAEIVCSALAWGVAKPLAEGALGPWLKQQCPDMDPFARGALQAMAAGPALGLALFTGTHVLGPAIKSLLGAAVVRTDGPTLFPDAGADAAEAAQVRAARERLMQTQASGRVGTVFGDLSALLPFGIAYASLGVSKASSPWPGTVAGGVAGAAMAALQSAMALLTRSDGMPSHQVVKPPTVPQAVKAAFDQIMVVTTPGGGKTESAAWRTRNLVQEFVVETLASIAGMVLANTYAEILARQGPASSDFETFARGLGGVYCTVGVFFFAIMPLGAERRGRTDHVFSGTAAALQDLSPFNHAGSTAKLFGLHPDSVLAGATNVLDGVHHTWRKASSLVGHLVLDTLNVITKPLHPPQPAAEGNLVIL